MKQQEISLDAEQEPSVPGAAQPSGHCPDELVTATINNQYTCCKITMTTVLSF